MGQSEIEHEESAEKIAQRDTLIKNASNEQRYKDAADEAEAFFNTMFPIAYKHAEALMPNAKKFEKEIPTMARIILYNYLGIWTVLLSRKYK